MATEFEAVTIQENPTKRSEEIKKAMIDEVVHDAEFRKQLLKSIYPEIVEMLEVEGWVRK